MNREIIAVLDPMCSWCWGFEPVLQELIKVLPTGVKLSVLLGGLRSKGDQPWTPEFRAYLREHWTEVQKRTGQGFDLSLFDREEFDYDTEPPCRAVVTLREMDEKRVFELMRALQEAFYLRGEDITKTDVIVNIIKSIGVEAQEFLEHFLSDEMKEKTEADRYKARSMGANAFPSLVFIDEEGHLCVMKGYRSFEKIAPYLS